MVSGQAASSRKSWNMGGRALTRHGGKRQRQRSVRYHTACMNVARVANVPSVYYAGRQEAHAVASLTKPKEAIGGKDEGPIQLSVRQPGPCSVAFERHQHTTEHGSPP